MEATSSELRDLDAIKSLQPRGPIGGIFYLFIFGYLAIKPKVPPGFSPSQQSSCLAL